MDGVWRYSKARQGQLLVMLAIADFANDDGKAWPSVGTLAEKSRLSERETRYVLRELERSGELKTLRNKGPRGCHVYEIKTAETQGAEIAGGQILPGAISNNGGAICDTLEGQCSAPEPSLNRHKNRHLDQPLDNFDLADLEREGDEILKRTSRIRIGLKGKV